MKQTKRLLLILLAVAMAVACCPSLADACGRCGVFGRGCRYVSSGYGYGYTYAKPTYYTPVVVQQAAVEPSVQNFVFNNTFPVPYLNAAGLAGSGNSVYGYSLQAQSYVTDPSLFMDRSARFTELAIEAGRAGAEGFAANTAAVIAANDSINRRNTNAAVAIAAIQANNDQPAAAQSLSFRATVQGGQLSIEKIPDHPGGGGAGVAEPAGADGVFSLSCGKCHDGSGKNDTPKGLTLDGSKSLTVEQLEKMSLKVIDGSMPPNNSWSLERKAAEVANLAKLLAAPE